MKLRNIIISLSIFLLTGCLCGCTDWLDYKPKDKQSEEQQFSTKDGFYAAVNGIYNRMAGNSLYGKYLSYEMIDVLAQRYTVNLTGDDSYSKYLQALINWDYSNETVLSALSSIWGEGYSTIMNTNVILNNLEKDMNGEGAGVLPEREYKMLKGEMLAARAMIHFDLLRLFGPVYFRNPEGRGIPYNESTETKILDILPTETVLKDYIIRDLKAAEALLLESDPVLTEGPRAEYDQITMDNFMRYRQLRLNYYATVLLTARTYLWGGDMGNALAEARKLTDDPKVRGFFPAVDSGTLLGNSVNPDLMFSTECLFGYYNKDRGLIYDYTFGGSNTGNKLLVPRAGYVDGQLFANNPGDYRYQSQWENGSTLDGNSSKRLVKFREITDTAKDEMSGSTSDENQILQVQKFHGTFCSIMKLSEAYYIAAEAMATEGSEVYDMTAAWNYLQQIFDSRGAVRSGNNFRDLLTKEYIREFIGEGQVFFYFKRLNKAFDNAYNGRQAIQIEIIPGLPFYDDKENVTEEAKEKRFIAPLPTNELDNR